MRDVSDLQIIRFISFVLFIGLFLLLCFLAGCSESLKVEGLDLSEPRKIQIVCTENKSLLDAQEGWKYIQTTEYQQKSREHQQGRVWVEYKPGSLNCTVCVGEICKTDISDAGMLSYKSFAEPKRMTLGFI
jgi:hypothetical protein